MAKTKARIKTAAAQKAGRGGGKAGRIKTKRAATKRYKVLGSGLVKVAQCNRRHLTGLKSRSLKNRLRRPKIMRKESMLLVRRCLPNSF